MRSFWQPSSAEVVEGEQSTRANCVKQSAVPGVEPRVHRVSQSVRRNVEREVWEIQKTAIYAIKHRMARRQNGTVKNAGRASDAESALRRP